MITLYLVQDEAGILVSAFPSTDPQWEANHFAIQKLWHVNIKTEGALNLVRNVLGQSGAFVFVED